MSERDELIDCLRYRPVATTAMQMREAADLLERDGAELDRLCAELETERMRLAGCGVAAMANTPTTVAQRITRDNPYWSASYGDVCRAVDREMALRAEVERLTADQNAVSEAIGTNEYLDPPDGGDVPLAEQVRRMRAEIERLKAGGCARDQRTTQYCAEARAALARAEAAEKAIERVLPAKAREHIDCWKVNYGLDRYDKVTAARRWAEAGGPSDGPIMALATAIEWLEST